MFTSNFRFFSSRRRLRCFCFADIDRDSGGFSPGCCSVNLGRPAGLLFREPLSGDIDTLVFSAWFSTLRCSRRDALASMLPLSPIERPTAAARPEAFDPALSCRNMPIRGRHLHFAVHHDRPILVYFLDLQRGREKLSREGGSHDRGCRRIQPSKRFRQTCLPRHRRLSFQACSWHIPIGRSDSRLERSIVRSCHPKLAHIHSIKTNTKYAPARRETHYEAAAASSICGAAARDGDSATTRQIARGFGRC
jgi:hypothetical protein